MASAPPTEVRVRRKLLPYTSNDCWDRVRLFAPGATPIDLIEAKSKARGLASVHGCTGRDFPRLNRILEPFCAAAQSHKSLLVVKSLLPPPPGRGGCDYSPVEQRLVFNLLFQWGSKFVPTELLGTRKNLYRYLRNLATLIGAGKGCVIPLSDLTHGLQLDQIAWLRSSATKATSYGRARVLQQLVLWLTESVFWGLVRGFFHPTETAYGRKRIFYFRKRVWQAMTDRYVDTMLNDGVLKRVKFDSTDPVCLVQKRELEKRLNELSLPSQSKARFLPKRQGPPRLIASREKADRREKADKDRDSRAMLQYFRKKFPESVDVKGHGLHKAWLRFVRKNRGKKIYFASVDIRDAFDSILLDKLRYVLDYFINTPTYMRHMFIHTVRYQSIRSKRVFRRDVVSESRTVCAFACPPGCRRLAAGPAGPASSRPVIVSSLVTNVKRRVGTHMFKLHQGRAGNYKHFCRTQGIAQGDDCASLLCDLYYGYMVKKVVRRWFAQDEVSQKGRMLVRGMDDFVFASINKEDVEKFLRNLQAGIPEYNCYIQPRKTVSNLTDDSVKEFSFCGAILNVETRESRPDFTAYLDKSIVHSIKFNVPIGVSLLQFIRQRMSFLVTLKLQALFTDESFNTPNTILANLFETFYVSAMRMDAMVTSLFFDRGYGCTNADPDKNRMNPPAFPSLAGLSDQIMPRLKKIVLSKLYDGSKPLLSGAGAVDRSEVEFLFYHAMSVVTGKRHAQYGNYVCKQVNKLRDRNVSRWANKGRKGELLTLSELVLQERRTSTIGSASYHRLN